MERVVAAGDHGAHARHLARPVGPDRLDHGVGVRRADDEGVQEARELEIRGVERGAGDLLDPVDALDVLAHPVVHGALRSRRVFAASSTASMIWR